MKLSTKNLDKAEAKYDQWNADSYDWMEDILQPIWDEICSDETSWDDIVILVDKMQQELETWRGMLDLTIDSANEYFRLQKCQDLSVEAIGPLITEWVTTDEEEQEEGKEKEC